MLAPDDEDAGADHDGAADHACGWSALRRRRDSRRRCRGSSRCIRTAPRSRLRRGGRPRSSGSAPTPPQKPAVISSAACCQVSACQPNGIDSSAIALAVSENHSTMVADLLGAHQPAHQQQRDRRDRRRRRARRRRRSPRWSPMPAPALNRVSFGQEMISTPISPTDDRAPAVDADRLAEEQRAEHDDQQRLRIVERDRLRQRQPRQRKEAERHGADADDAARDVAERPRGRQRGAQLAAPGKTTPGSERPRRRSGRTRSRPAGTVAGRLMEVDMPTKTATETTFSPMPVSVLVRLTSSACWRQ